MLYYEYRFKTPMKRYITIIYVIYRFKYQNKLYSAYFQKAVSLCFFIAQCRKKFRFIECFEVRNHWHGIHLISVVVIESGVERRELTICSRKIDNKNFQNHK